MDTRDRHIVQMVLAGMNILILGPFIYLAPVWWSRLILLGGILVFAGQIARLARRLREDSRSPERRL